MLTQIGKYQLIRKIATGGMAEVYLAKAAGPMGFEKTLVLKRILPHLAEDESFVQMFLGEAKLAAQLNHPNVVQIFDFGEAEGAHFIAMEFIDGPNLRGLSKRARELGRRLPFVLCAKTISFAAEGLAYAHDFADPATGAPLGLIHRDISPDNILLGRNGGVKVVDFGIAKAAGQTHHTRTGTLKGKLAYMPPEQLQQKPLDRRVDVFALGMVLYELLAGTKPFDATSEVTIMQAILYEPLVPIVARRPDIPAPLQAIVERALAKDRDQRYPSCREMQLDLERFILSTGEPVGAYHLAALVKELAAPPAAPISTPISPTAPQTGPAVTAPTVPMQENAPTAMTEPHASAPASAGSVTSAPTVASGLAAPVMPTQVTGGVSGLVPTDAATMPARTEPSATSVVVPPRSRAPMIVAALVVALVAAAGGYFALDTGDDPIPEPRAPGSTAVAIAPPAADSKKPDPEKAAPPAAPVDPAEAPEKVAVAEHPAPTAAPELEPAPEPARPEAIEPAVAEALPTPVEPARAVRPSRRTNHPKQKQETTASPEQKQVVVAAAETVKLAHFRVESSPPAQVKVNGKFIGLSPVVASGVEPGEVEVEVYDSRLGFRKKQRFNVAAGDNGTRKVVVAPGTLEFRVRPYATVMLDDRALGQTPFAAVQVYEGRHKVRLINRDIKKDVTVPFDVKPGENIFKYNLSE